MAKKKLFISCPMKGRTEENIKKSMEKMQRMAELIWDQEFEVIPSYIEHNPPKTNNQAIWYLGESIKKLSEADYFIGIEYCYFYKGCNTEASIADQYGIKTMQVDMLSFAPDCKEIIEAERGKMYDNSGCTKAVAF